MVEKNICIDCGEELPNTEIGRCKECIKKGKRKHLSNGEVLARYYASRGNLKRGIENLIKRIDQETKRLSELTEKFILNEYNQGILRDKMNDLTIFRDKLIESWEVLKE